MDARAQRTLLRVGTLLAALIVTVLILVLVPDLDSRLEAVVLGAAITAALGLDQWLKNGDGPNAVPTVGGINAALELALPAVAPPTVNVPKPPTLTVPADPNVPPPGV